jgi:hypothetical protein
VTRVVLKLREAGIQCEKRKTLNRVDERGVILIHSDSDRERAAYIVRNMGLQVQTGSAQGKDLDLLSSPKNAV